MKLLKNTLFILFSFALFGCNTTNENFELVAKELQIVKDWIADEDKIYAQQKNIKVIEKLEKNLLEQQARSKENLALLKLRTDEAKEFGELYIEVSSSLTKAKIANTKFEQIKSPTELDHLERSQGNQAFQENIIQFHRKARDLQTRYKVKLLD